MKKDRTKCLRPDCERSAYARGLCVTCYARARALIKDGITTWAKLEKNGKSIKSNGQNTGAIKDWLLSK